MNADFLNKSKDETCTRYGNPSETKSLGDLASVTDPSRIKEGLMGNLIGALRFEVHGKNILSN